MSTEREVESDILRLGAAKLEEEGYTVFLDPPSSMLPESLKALRPDGIAVGKKPNLIIEVTSEGARSLMRVQKLHDAIRNDDAWQIQLLFTGGKPTEMETLPLAYIKDTVRNIEAVAREDARPALLMCWSYLEALTRSLEPEDFSRAQSPSRIVEKLASLAYVGPSDAAFLRDMSERRNKFAHGQLTTKVERTEIARFIQIIEAIISLALARSL